MAQGHSATATRATRASLARAARSEQPRSTRLSLAGGVRGRQARRYAWLREQCAGLGLRLTPQRDVLLRVLSAMMGHPTADELVRKVRAVLPSVSHATVYRNVQELVRTGLIGTLDRAGGPVQFEVNPEHHHHFVCRRCGRVWDVYLADVGIRLDHRRSQLKGFQIDRREVQLHGLCARCR